MPARKHLLAHTHSKFRPEHRSPPRIPRRTVKLTPMFLAIHGVTQKDNRWGRQGAAPAEAQVCEIEFVFDRTAEIDACRVPLLETRQRLLKLSDLVVVRDFDADSCATVLLDHHQHSVLRAVQPLHTHGARNEVLERVSSACDAGHDIGDVGKRPFDPGWSFFGFCLLCCADGLGGNLIFARLCLLRWLCFRRGGKPRLVAGTHGNQ
mmetsp:Transcript_16708/g.51877  ORF Transcript_16708/g.51877 Transcript_16708/m.51877 type:complete len:207 (-) Transcript_16708:22-642(-)